MSRFDSLPVSATLAVTPRLDALEIDELWELMSRVDAAGAHEVIFEVGHPAVAQIDGKIERLTEHALSQAEVDLMIEWGFGPGSTARAAQSRIHCMARMAGAHGRAHYADLVASQQRVRLILMNQEEFEEL